MSKSAALSIETPARPARRAPRPKSHTTTSATKYKILYHPDVAEAVEKNVPLRKRLGMVIRQLAAHGQSSIIKGCSEPGNQGWLRSPMGGNQGMQAYLWWRTLASTGQGGKDAGKTILVRALRHHDDHSRLKPGKPSDYLEFSRDEITDEDWIDSPWTQEQEEFVESRGRVHTLYGRPGAGKTTALFEHINRAGAKKTCYLSWSRDLARQANEYFESFGRPGEQFQAQSFAQFLGELAGFDLPPGTLERSRNAFEEETAKLTRSMLTHWHNTKPFLHAEMRAHLYGAAAAYLTDDLPPDELPRLPNDVYLKERGGREACGDKAAKALLSAADTLETEAFRRCFPELLAARIAWKRARKGDLPDFLLDVDQIVIDECQDLTILEIAAVIEIAKALGKNHKDRRVPKVVFAGDEGQTVRPTGFSWGRLHDLLHQELTAPIAHSLAGNLRSPEKIEAVIQRVSGLYSDLEKHNRPGKQVKGGVPPATDANLVQVEIDSAEEATRLVNKLSEIDRLAVIVPCERADEIQLDLRDEKNTILEPAAVKGLEFQTACIINPGHHMDSLVPGNWGTDIHGAAEAHRRYSVDSMRVAISRATENLVFLSICEDEYHRHLEYGMLGSEALHMSSDDLLEFLDTADITPEERVNERIKTALAIADENIERAWWLAEQAYNLLGDPGLPNGVADPELRDRVIDTFAELCFSFVAQAPEGGFKVSAACAFLYDIIRDCCSEKYAHDIASMVEQWPKDPSKKTMAMLCLVVESGLDQKMEWPHRAFTQHSNALSDGIREAAKNPAQAGLFVGKLDRITKLIGLDGMHAPQMEKITRQASDTLIASGNVSAAHAVVAQWLPQDRLRAAKVLELQGHLEGAAENYEMAGEKREALRCWRNAGEFSKAIELSKGQVKRDLQWLQKFSELMEKRPQGHEKRMTAAESEFMHQSIKATPRKKAKGKRKKKKAKTARA